jgi:hypothetical protein
MHKILTGNDLFVLSVLACTDKGISVNDMTLVSNLGQYNLGTSNLHSYKLLLYQVLERLEKKGYVAKKKDSSIKYPKYKYFLLDEGFRILVAQNVNIAKRIVEAIS